MEGYSQQSLLFSHWRSSHWEKQQQPRYFASEDTQTLGLTIPKQPLNCGLGKSRTYPSRSGQSLFFPWFSKQLKDFELHAMKSWDLSSTIILEYSGWLSLGGEELCRLQYLLGIICCIHMPYSLYNEELWPFSSSVHIGCIKIPSLQREEPSTGMFPGEDLSPEYKYYKGSLSNIHKTSQLWTFKIIQNQIHLIKEPHAIIWWPPMWMTLKIIDKHIRVPIFLIYSIF